MKIAIIDYGMGNLGSVRRAFEVLGAKVSIIKDPGELTAINRIVLPGVGSFKDGMDRLQSLQWKPAIEQALRNNGVALLGICLGMQMLAEFGEEGGLTDGLGLISGTVKKLDKFGCSIRIPHVGWNEVTNDIRDPLYKNIPQKTDFYFVHSYAFEVSNPETQIGYVDYDGKITASVRLNNIFGTQFHPEKSSKAGHVLLKNFMEYTPC